MTSREEASKELASCLEQSHAAPATNKGPELCPEPASEFHCVVDSWEFPLSRPEKVLRLLRVFEAEVDEGNRELVTLRRENAALKARAQAAEQEAAEAKRMLEEISDMQSKSSGACGSSSSRAQVMKQDHTMSYDLDKLENFEREMERKALEALAAAADLDHEADGRSSDFESAASSSVPSPRRQRLQLASSGPRQNIADAGSTLQPAQSTPPSTPQFTHRSVCACGPAAPPPSPALAEPGGAAASAPSTKASEDGRANCLSRSPGHGHTAPFVVRSNSWSARARTLGCGLREDSVDPLPALMTPVLSARPRHLGTARDRRSPRAMRVGSPEPVLRRVGSKDSLLRVGSKDSLLRVGSKDAVRHRDRTPEPPEHWAVGNAHRSRLRVS